MWNRAELGQIWNLFRQPEHSIVSHHIIRPDLCMCSNKIPKKSAEYSNTNHFITFDWQLDSIGAPKN